MDSAFSILYGLEDDAYRKRPGVSQSELKVAMDCPQRLEAMRRGIRQPETPAMFEGKLLHSSGLEPDTFEQTYAVCGPRNTKAGKEQAKEIEAAGQIAITQTQWNKAMGFRLALAQNPLASFFLSSGEPEVSIFSEDEETGLAIKGRLDWIQPNGTIVDLKTVGAGKASPKEFAKQVASFKYHVQAAHYLELAQADRFVFIVVEREAPFLISCVELDQAALIEGENIRRRALRLVADCELSGDWPGYTPELQTLSLPSWAFEY
jgi:hypothetical protein|tara:strand:+ start:8171 stop:8959 length:789 start_codon:yes stop_codon:yes gene_type:complete